MTLRKRREGPEPPPPPEPMIQVEGFKVHVTDAGRCIVTNGDGRAAGGLPALRLIGSPADVLRETKERIFAA